MSNSFHFDDVDLSSNDYKCIVSMESFPLLSAPKLQIQTVPYMDGAIYQGSYLEPMKFTLNCWIQASSKEELIICLDNLKYLFNTTTVKPIWFDDYFSDRFWKVRLTSPIDIQLINLATAETKLEFVAPDPTSYTKTPTTLENQSGNITVTTSIGTADPLPVLEFNGVITPSFSITNTVTNETLSIANDFEGMIQIDSERKIVLSSTNGGLSWIPYMMNVSGLFPTLRAKAENSLSITGFTGTYSLSFRERYL